MKMKVTGSSEQLTEEKIDCFEKRIGYLIPPSYRTFLLKHNGGKVDPSEFTIVGKNKDSTQNGSAIKCFLGINMSEETFNLDYVIGTFHNRVPSSLFPIARDPGGNLICISIQGEDANKVYFWDHDREVEETGDPNYENVYLIANSFQDFINNLS